MKQHVVNMQYLIGNIAYPVGSVYISYNSTDPQQLFGGTWEKISGKFLLASDNNTHSTTGVGSGSETKTITTNNLPSITSSVSTTSTDKDLVGRIIVKGTDNTSGNYRHRVVTAGGGICSVSNGGGDYPSVYDQSKTTDQTMVDINARHEHTGTATFTGLNQALDIMPPYVVVNMWKRKTLATVETVTTM